MWLPPVGLIDRLPAEARLRTALTAELFRRFELRGYQRIITPAFERESVMDLGLEMREDERVRFMDPATQEVVVLRPDITPQVARIIATKMQDRPLPIRISYGGSVIRQTRARGQTSRQREHFGIEHVGDPSLACDVEVIASAIHACQALGLRALVIELCAPALARATLQAIAPALRPQAQRALAAKDTAQLEALLSQREGDKTIAELIALSALYGPVEPTLASAKAAWLGAAHAPTLLEIERTYHALRARCPEAELSWNLDLGEARRHTYYTGTSFAILAQGPDDAIARGGRYDALLARYGFDAPAFGFAFDLDRLQWALDVAEVALPSTPQVIVDDRVAHLAEALREAGVIAACAPHALLEPHARAAHAEATLDHEGRLHRQDGAHAPWDAIPDLAAWLRA